MVPYSCAGIRPPEPITADQVWGEGKRIGRKERERERDWGAEGGRWGEIRTACGAALAPRPTHSHSDSQAKLVLFKNCRASETQGEGSSEFGERARRERRSRESCLRRSERSAPGSWPCWRRMGGTMPAARGGSEQMMSEMSFSGRDSIPQEGAPGSRNARVRRAVRISSIVAQEVRRVRSRLFVCRCTRYGLCQSSFTEMIIKWKEIIKCYC